MTPSSSPPPWTVSDAETLYGVRHWGAGYFGISEKGAVTVHPHGNRSAPAIELVELAADLHARGITTPILLRFSDILAARIRTVNEAFLHAISESEYQGDYRCVYPIKVNQKHQVVRDIVEYGASFHCGLEAGSKAELIAAIASIEDPETCIVCNGYKDEEFIDLALLSLKIGIQTCIVVEMPAEAQHVLDRARHLGIRPLLGVRARLSARAGGHWDGSGGDRSKFGMDAAQAIAMVDRLRDEGMLDCLRMLHYHLGSQVPDIRSVRVALNEACRFYADLAHEGAPMGILNVGGGLGVDYDGSRTSLPSSCNYSMQEYAADLVDIIMNVLGETGVPHPTIVSESGRALTAHHSVLVFNVLHAKQFDTPSDGNALDADSDEMLHNLAEVRDTVTRKNAQELYHDVVYYRERVRAAFVEGRLSLRERALGEGIFRQAIRRIADAIGGRTHIPEEMADIGETISDVYYGNFSLFQSVPDSWAIGQVFPVMPLHRLDERPDKEAVLADISCDSDGKIDRFADQQGAKRSLPVHALNDSEYYMGVFLVGAYQ
ncbi:MAG: biosynthetic arginine decarboxylase, partial [Lentisphaerae bacterium]|nr:biosynthetic arginine decarboxylase [Lentisphaerota bacterium]